MQPSDGKSEGPTSAAEFLTKNGVMGALVCGITAVAYLGTLSFGFVYDDKPVIVDNPSLRSWDFVSKASGPGGQTFFRPVTSLWLRLNYLAFGLQPAGWHFAMVALHVLTTYLVFALARKLTANRATAAIAALLFGLHPVHVENVAWLSSVNDLLMSALLVGSFLAYLKFRDGGKVWMWMGTSLLLFGLALLTKETTAAFPLLILGYAVLFARSDNGDGASFSSTLSDALKHGLASAPYFIVLVVYLAVRRTMLPGMMTPISALSWTTMILTWPSVLWFDLKHLVFPITSSEFYSLTYVGGAGFENFWLPGLLLLIAIAIVGYGIARLPNPRLGVFALVWTLVPILPTLYLRAIAPDNFVHDRFLYLPSVGIVIVMALAVEQITTHVSASMKWVIVGIICLVAFAGTLVHQVQWASNLLLYQNGLKYAPQNLTVQDNFANELANLGRYDSAIPLYLNVLERNPRFWSSNYNLGYTYYRAGRYSEAEDYLNRAIRIDDRDPDEFIFLARAQMQQGKLEEAERNAERALERGPRSPGFHFILAKILEARGQRERAIAEYQAEVLHHPENALARNELQRLQSTP